MSEQDNDIFHPAAKDIALADVMRALADPARLEMVAQLAKGTCCCSDIGDDTSLHKSTVSHHLRVLREAGLTQTSVQGRMRAISLRRKDLDKRFPGLLDALLASVNR